MSQHLREREGGETERENETGINTESYPEFHSGTINIVVKIAIL